MTITLPVVSVKPFWDSQYEPLLGALVDSYQRLLAATANCNSGLCLQSAGDLEANLRLLEQSITLQFQPADVLGAQENTERHLHAWHDRTQDYLRHKAAEKKDLMVLVAKTAESVGERDQKYNWNLKAQPSGSKTSPNWKTSPECVPA